MPPSCHNNLLLLDCLVLSLVIYILRADPRCLTPNAIRPENLAVEALQDFSCRDLSTIRNKSAYLMGYALAPLP